MSKKKKTNKKPIAQPVKKSNKGRIAVISCIAVIAIAIIVILITKPFGGKNSQHYYADINVKDYGTITVELDPTYAPITVENFVSLAKSGFYDGLTFHRIMDGFMIQGGDPEGTGNGNSGKNIKGEFSANNVKNELSHTRGVISMARSAVSYDSASCQFFIVQSDSTFLDGQYASFGWVTEGMDIVDQICADAQPVDNNGTILAEEQPIITSITISDAE